MDFFSQVTFLASLAVVVVQQIAKLNAFPVAFFNDHPVPGVILLSAIAAVVVDWTGLQSVHTVGQWLALGGKILVVAAITYNATIKNWVALREMEGPGK